MEPYSLVGGMGEGSWSNWGLAYGLKDQRLMARPPARAGGRSDSLTVGESRKLKGCVSKKTKTKKLIVFSRLFPKGTHPRPQPAQPVGGPLPAFQREGRRPGTKKEVQPPPHSPTREGGPGGGTSSPGGSFPHFFPRNGAPAGQAPFPAVPTA